MSAHWFEPWGWKRIEPYLDWALDLQPLQREAWLAELTTTQPDIAGTLRAMLAEIEVINAEGFLEVSPFASFTLVSTDERPRAGRYVSAYIID